MQRTTLAAACWLAAMSPALAHPAPSHASSAAPAARQASDFKAGESFDAVVVRVIEADLYVVRPLGARASAGEQATYLLGADTPEAGQGAWADQARQHVSALVQGKRVRLTLDQAPRARCGTLRAYVHLADGTFLNLALVREGWADVLSKQPNMAHDAEFKVAMAAAKVQGLGIWAKDGGLAATPSAFRHAQSDHGAAEHAGHGCKH